MRVKCIKAYQDLQLKRLVNVGEEFEVSDSRGKELTTVNNKSGRILCEEVTTPTTEKVAEAAPKKSRKKKEA